VEIHIPERFSKQWQDTLLLLDIQDKNELIKEVTKCHTRLRTGTRSRLLYWVILPLATDTTIKVTVAMTMEEMALHCDWVIKMVDVEAAFLTAPVDRCLY
jgi:hypothetical protein